MSKLTPKDAATATLPWAEDEPDEVPATDVDEPSAALLALLTDEPRACVAIPSQIHGVVVGTLLSLDGGPRVAWEGAPDGVAARAFTAIAASAVGREVALMFEAGDPARPLVMGVVESFSAPLPAVPTEAVTEAFVDGERVVLEAERELVLRCGKASITLTRAGKVLIRGAYVSSHATGTQRIRGGTVEIN